MSREDILAGLLQELRRGSIVMLVLSRLQSPKYGYHLVKDLEEHGMPVEANTLYPLMRRLETQGLLQSVWDTGESKPRKYYQITEDGRYVLGQMRRQWNTAVHSINSLLEETNDG